MQKKLGAPVSQLQWLLEAYELFLSALLLLGGAMGDYYGRKKIFIWGLVVFGLASCWCSLAPDIEQLILARSLQGIGGAMLVPGSLAIITAFFDESERGRAIGTWSAFSAVTTAVGPLLGGYLAEEVSWRLVFFINIPIIITVIVIVIKKVPESQDRTTTQKLDWFGALTITLSMGLLVYVFTEASSHSLAEPEMFTMLIAGTVLFFVFIYWETKTPHPMLPLGLFSNRTFLGANLLTLFLYAAFRVLLFFFPFHLQQLHGYTATEAAATFFPFVVIMAVLSRKAGALVDRYGAKGPLVFGPALTAVGIALFALPGLTGSFWVTFFVPMVVMALGMVLTVAPLTTAVMNAHAERSGLSSGINNSVSRLAGLLGVALSGFIMIKLFSGPFLAGLNDIAIEPGIKQQLVSQLEQLAGMKLPGELGNSQLQKLQSLLKESFLWGFRNLSYVAAALAMLASIVALFIIPGKQTKSG